MKNTIKLATAIAVIAGTQSAHSATIWSEDFNAKDINGGTIGSGFVMGNRNHASGGEWFAGAAAVNSPEKYSKLEDAGNGDIYLSKFSDYSADGPFGPGQWGGSTDASTYVYRDVMNFDADDVGDTVTFSFDARRTNLDTANASANAYIKVLETVSWGEVALVEADAAGFGTDWSAQSISLEITPALVGGLLQIGFTDRASSDGTQAGTAATGVNYDNLVVEQVAAVPVPAAAWLFGSALAGLVAARRRK